MSEYLSTLDKYITTLITKINTKSKINKIPYAQKISIANDLEGLSAKAFETDKNAPNFKEIFLGKVIPYLSRICQK